MLIEQPLNCLVILSIGAVLQNRDEQLPQFLNVRVEVDQDLDLTLLLCLWGFILFLDHRGLLLVERARDVLSLQGLNLESRLLSRLLLHLFLFLDLVLHLDSGAVGKLCKSVSYLGQVWQESHVSGLNHLVELHGFPEPLESRQDVVVEHLEVDLSQLELLSGVN